MSAKLLLDPAANPPKGTAEQDEVATRHWPSPMPRALAAEFTGVDESTIDRHRRAGLLVPAGRRGGIGPWVYSKAELTRWMCGDVGNGTTPSAVETTPRSTPRQVQPAKTAQALDRLARVVRGGGGSR